MNKYIPFLQFILLISLISCTNKSNMKKNNQNHKIVEFYVGTYTDNESRGIYQYQIDENGNFLDGKLVAQTENPSFLTINKNQTFLLAVNENKQGQLSTFKIDKDTLKFTDQISTNGAHPCFVSTNVNDQVAVANYSSGNVSLFSLSNLGKLTFLDNQQHHGHGRDTNRQEGPHAHSVYFTKDNQVLSADLGSNQLVLTNIHKGKFSAAETFAMDPNNGPRHIAFHPNEKWVYVLNELSNTVAQLTQNKQGKFQLSTSISTLPKHFDQYNTSADIHITQDGKFLYTSNRGHNSIALFKILNNGNLQSIDYFPTRGQTPRNFALTPNEHYIVIANQDSNNLVCYERSKTSGKLKYLSEIHCPKPVCILFKDNN